MELLAPAGNYQKFKSAVLYGADAVYLAGPRYGLRSASDNFSDLELQQAVEFAHARKRKVYVTLNAFLHEADMVSLPKYVEFLAECEVDSVIIADLGVMSVVQEKSKIPIHLSTQASCLNLESAKAWKEMGVKRIILGREASIEQARIIQQEAGLEVEMFIHGAMCMAYSGNCTISNYTAGRDSNRGGCIQSCRFSYSVIQENSVLEDKSLECSPTSLMSSKDLRGLDLLPKFLKTGVESIKVEGRMKSSLYAATTINAYALALKWCDSTPQEQWPEKLKELSGMLEKIPHRGYTYGYLKYQPESAVTAGAESIYQGDRNGRNSGYEFAGTVMEVEKSKSFTMLTQNSFDSDRILEVLTFDGSVIEIATQEMRTLNNTPVQRANPNRLLRFSFSEAVEKSADAAGTFLIQPLNVVRLKT